MSEFSKLKWRCRRGIKELDILLTSYLEHHYNHALVSEQQTFQILLELADPDLYAYLTRQKVPLDKQLNDLIEKLTTI